MLNDFFMKHARIQPVIKVVLKMVLQVRTSTSRISSQRTVLSRPTVADVTRSNAFIDDPISIEPLASHGDLDSNTELEFSVVHIDVYRREGGGVRQVAPSRLP